VITSIIGWIIVGLIAGVIAKAIMPGRDPGGVIVTILIGIVGAIIGGFIGRTLLGYNRGDVGDPGFIMGLVLAIIGALVLLAGYRLIRGRSLKA